MYRWWRALSSSAVGFSFLSTLIGLPTAQRWQGEGQHTQRQCTLRFAYMVCLILLEVYLFKTWWHEGCTPTSSCGACQSLLLRQVASGWATSLTFSAGLTNPALCLTDNTHIHPNSLCQLSDIRCFCQNQQLVGKCMIRDNVDQVFACQTKSKVVHPLFDILHVMFPLVDTEIDQSNQGRKKVAACCNLLHVLYYPESYVNRAVYSPTVLMGFLYGMRPKEYWKMPRAWKRGRATPMICCSRSCVQRSHVPLGFSTWSNTSFSPKEKIGTRWALK